MTRSLGRGQGIRASCPRRSSVKAADIGGQTHNLLAGSQNPSLTSLQSVHGGQTHLAGPPQVTAVHHTEQDVSKVKADRLGLPQTRLRQRGVHALTLDTEPTLTTKFTPFNNT